MRFHPVIASQFRFTGPPCCKASLFFHFSCQKSPNETREQCDWINVWRTGNRDSPNAPALAS
jgi:hypothetical protein